MPMKPWPEEVIFAPFTCTSMSSQWANSSIMLCALIASLALRFSIVWSENTTPQPNVSPGRLRSNTTTSQAGSRSFIEIAK
jgi:hypothetical protein